MSLTCSNYDAAGTRVFTFCPCPFCCRTHSSRFASPELFAMYRDLLRLDATNYTALFILCLGTAAGIPMNSFSAMNRGFSALLGRRLGARFLTSNTFNASNT